MQAAHRTVSSADSVSTTPTASPSIAGIIAIILDFTFVVLGCLG